MIIRLKVFEQTLSIVDTKSVPRKGSKDYLILQFMFSSDWKDLDKLCYLQCGEVSQPIEVVDNLVEVPEWFTQQDRFYVTLFGKSGSQEVPTNVVPLRLEKSNTLWEQDAPDPQPSWLAKVIDMNNHPPVPGDNGYWLLWDTDSNTYVESEFPLPDMSGIPDGGTAGQLLSKTESGTEWIDPPQSGVQPDWNQNDETQPDYVKNRPFYTGNPVETVLVEESTVQFTDIGGLYTGAIKSTFSPTVGNAYKISWDGTDYESTCVKVGRYTHIGNLSIDGSGPDTGEPFLMLVRNQDIAVATLDGSFYHTISISRFVPGVVVKIDPKYLPDNPLNITGATVGQIAKITAVDDSGKPTAWEAVDMSSGGDEKWRLVRTITLEENVTAIDISEDNDGNPFALKKIRINGYTLGTASGGQLRINVANKNDDSYSILGPYTNFRGLDTTKRWWFAESECLGIIGDGGKWSERYNTPDSTGIGATYERGYFRTPRIDSGRFIQDRVEFLHIFSNTSSVEFAAGSYIELWGVDA